VLALSRG